MRSFKLMLRSFFPLLGGFFCVSVISPCEQRYAAASSSAGSRAKIAAFFFSKRPSRPDNPAAAATKRGKSRQRPRGSRRIKEAK